GEPRQRVVWRGLAGGAWIALSAAYLTGWIGVWVLPAAALAAAGLSFPIVKGWRRGSAATAAICLAAGSGRLDAIAVCAGLAAAALAWDRGARRREAAWSVGSALLAAVAAWGSMVAVGPRGIAAACVFAAVYYLVDSALNLL